MDRRSFLQAGAVSLLGAAPKQATGFRQRGYLGWITDLASEPEVNTAWPSIRLDERLLDDYTQTFRLMKTLGYTHISVWGLFVSRSWPVDIPRSIDRPRRALVEKLIAAAHQHGIRVLAELDQVGHAANDVAVGGLAERGLVDRAISGGEAVIGPVEFLACIVAVRFGPAFVLRLQDPAGVVA